MSLRTVTALSLATGLTLMLSAPPADADAERGKKLYEVCAACHGADGGGNKDLNAPAVAGLGAWYVTRQVGHFKDGVRGADPKDVYGTQMRPMALTLPDDAAVAAVAAYIDTLKPAKPAATVAGDVEAGKTAYAVCTACHGPNGEGNEALNSPALRGQHDWYIVRQLKAYKSGMRGTNAKDTFGAQMRPMAMTLADDAAIANVAAYIATFE